jgi:hypothetical protein
MLTGTMMIIFQHTLRIRALISRPTPYHKDEQNDDAPCHKPCNDASAAASQFRTADSTGVPHVAKGATGVLDRECAVEIVVSLFRAPFL